MKRLHTFFKDHEFELQLLVGIVIVLGTLCYYGHRLVSG